MIKVFHETFDDANLAHEGTPVHDAKQEFFEERQFSKKGSRRRKVGNQFKLQALIYHYIVYYIIEQIYCIVVVSCGTCMLVTR